MEKKADIRWPFVLAKGLLGAAALSAASILIMAVLLLKTGIRENTIHMVSVAMYAVSCLAAGFYCGKKIKSKRFLWGLLAGTLYFALLCLLTIAVKGGHLSDHVLTSALVCLGSGMLGGMVSG